MGESNNIYFNARKAAGMTQEHWAEMLGVSVETIRRYEAGVMMPTDDVVLAMGDLSGLQILGTWHLRLKSRVAAKALPEVRRLPLPQAVCQLLAAIRDFETNNHADTLITIAADGRVAADEAEMFERILTDLQPLIRAAMQIEYAER